MVIGTYILIITLNLNGLNAPTKRHRLAEWTQKQDPYICCLQETHFRPRDTHTMKVRGWKKIFHANGNEKKAGVAILLSDKIDFKIKNVTSNKMAVNTYKSITTLNVNGLNAPIKKHGVADWIKKQDPCICCL